MSSGLHHAAANLKSKHFEGNSHHATTQNGLKQGKAAFATKDPPTESKTSTAKPGRPSKSSAAGSRSSSTSSHTVARPAAATTTLSSSSSKSSRPSDHHPHPPLSSASKVNGHSSPKQQPQQLCGKPPRPLIINALPQPGPPAANQLVRIAAAKPASRAPPPSSSSPTKLFNGVGGGPSSNNSMGKTAQELFFGPAQPFTIFPPNIFPQHHQPPINAFTGGLVNGKSHPSSQPGQHLVQEQQPSSNGTKAAAAAQSINQSITSDAFLANRITEILGGAPPIRPANQKPPTVVPVSRDSSTSSQQQRSKKGPVAIRSKPPQPVTWEAGKSSTVAAIPPRGLPQQPPQPFPAMFLQQPSHPGFVSPITPGSVIQMLYPAATTTPTGTPLNGLPESRASPSTKRRISPAPAKSDSPRIGGGITSSVAPPVVAAVKSKSGKKRKGDAEVVAVVPSAVPFLPAPLPPAFTPPPSAALATTTIATAAASANDVNFDELLSSLQAKIADDDFDGGGGGGGKPDDRDALNLSPRSDFLVDKMPGYSVPPTELKARLRKARRNIKVVDLGLQEEIMNLTATFAGAVIISKRKRTLPVTAAEIVGSVPTVVIGGMTAAVNGGGGVGTAPSNSAASRGADPVVEIAANARVALPFKKRLYPCVPSPKSPKMGKETQQQHFSETSKATGGKEGREKNGATSSSRTPAVTSPAAATSATGSKAKDSATSASTSGVSPKIPTLKISLKFNQATGKAYTNSPQSSLSVSSPKSMSISPSVKSPTITTANTPSPRKKRPLDKDAPSTSSSAASCSPSPAKRRNSAAGGVKPGDYEMTCNSYSEARLRKKHPDSDLMLCECRPPPADQPNAVGCGDSCGSRNSYMECDPATCPCGTRCSNQTIQRGQGVADLELFQTPQKGQGVRCKSNIKKGTFICEYIGEVLSTDKFIDRMKEKGYKEAAHHYFLKLDHNKVIDAYRCGSIARFINHSCEPNSQTQKWLVNGQDRMAFFAREDIPAGQEITYDYKFESFDEQPQKCFCGTKSCRGTIGVKKSQKLNGLLMKKKQTAASSSTAELSAHASQSSSAVSSPKPASLVIPAPVIKERVAVSAETAASDPAEMWREAQFSLKHMIFLGRNRRHGVALGRRSGGKRPKIVPQILITSLPALCSTTVKALFPASQGFPAEYFKPVAWEPSVADVAKYSAPPFQEEVIRCICGIYMEDSTMVECDRCKNWQHCECVGHIPIGRNASYLCDRCAPRPLPREIHQNLPAASNPDNLDCYNTLLVPNCQNFYVRVGDCVYLTKDRQPPLPGLLYDPLTVDILFVDKMWMNSAGVKWIFGWHYLRPHETFHEASRSFFEQELLKTSHHLETVKLDAVLGRCCVMDSQTFAKGKPKEYPLQHCFICDLKVNKATNQFVTMKAKERVTVNTHQYYFELYPERLTVRRTFKPHQVPVLKKKLKMDAALSARKPSDAPESDTNMIKDRCLHIHSVLENLARRRQPLSSKADS